TPTGRLPLDSGFTDALREYGSRLLAFAGTVLFSSAVFVLCAIVFHYVHRGQSTSVGLQETLRQVLNVTEVFMLLHCALTVSGIILCLLPVGYKFEELPASFWRRGGRIVKINSCLTIGLASLFILFTDVGTAGDLILLAAFVVLAQISYHVLDSVEEEARGR